MANSAGDTTMIAYLYSLSEQNLKATNTEDAHSMENYLGM